MLKSDSFAAHDSAPESWPRNSAYKISASIKYAKVFDGGTSDHESHFRKFRRWRLWRNAGFQGADDVPGRRGEDQAINGGASSRHPPRDRAGRRTGPDPRRGRGEAAPECSDDPPTVHRTWPAPPGEDREDRRAPEERDGPRRGRVSDQETVLMAITFNIEEDLKATEAALVDWKRRVRRYEDKKIPVPEHILARIELLKEDARLLRRQMSGEDG